MTRSQTQQLQSLFRESVRDVAQAPTRDNVRRYLELSRLLDAATRSRARAA
jgi:hypothetical protein